MKALAELGADIIELGLPFSDPLADGIVNQMAAERALKAGMTTARVLELIRAFRATHETPIVLFTYLNPVSPMASRSSTTMPPPPAPTASCC